MESNTATPQDEAHAEEEQRSKYSIKVEIHLKTRQQRKTAPIAVSFQAAVRRAVDGTPLEVSNFMGARTVNMCGWRRHSSIDVTFDAEGSHEDGEQFERLLEKEIHELALKDKPVVGFGLAVSETSNRAIDPLILLPFVAFAFSEKTQPTE